MTFRRFFDAICAVFFVASVATAIGSCASMPAMGELPMPGGWTMSTIWAPMCGQTWLGAATGFVGMWLAMTVAMMLPLLTPKLWTYREALRRIAPRRADVLAVLAGVGYFAVWTLPGVVVFAFGAAAMPILLTHATLARAVPPVAGAVVLIAGILQFSAWKQRRLACCRAPSQCDRHPPADARGALRHGMRLGLRCIACCANLTAILLVVGAMDLRVMALTTAAITAERLAADAAHVARIVGAVAFGAGLAHVAQAALRLG